MSIFAKGYEAVHEKKAAIEAAKSGSNTAFPYIKVHDGLAEHDPEKPSEVLFRFLDTEPITMNVWVLEKGRVRFIAQPGDALSQAYEGTKTRPQFRGIYPVLVYSKDSEEFNNYIESILDEDDDEEELRERFLNHSVDETKIYRLDMSYGVLAQIEGVHKRKKLKGCDIVMSRTGSGPSDTKYSFESQGKSKLSKEYAELELPKWEELYKLPDDSDVSAYLNKGYEGLKAHWESKRSNNDSADDAPKKSAKKKKRAKPADDDDEDVEVDWE